MLTILLASFLTFVDKVDQKCEIILDNPCSERSGTVPALYVISNTSQFSAVKGYDQMLKKPGLNLDFEKYTYLLVFSGTPGRDYSGSFQLETKNTITKYVLDDLDYYVIKTKSAAARRNLDSCPFSGMLLIAIPQIHKIEGTSIKAVSFELQHTQQVTTSVKATKS